MPAMTYDGRSFMIDGRRIWIVGGSMHYARTPRELWRQRIHAAKLAGLNTIETPVVWVRHEPRAGHFDFTGENDLRHFVELVGQAGLWCVLRMGPFVGSAYDQGGIPPWVGALPNVQLRRANPAFLDAAARFIGAVADQVKDLQVTSSGAGGPILLVQNETHWTCGDDQAGPAYLGELGRYLREAGLSVPTINTNNLWQSVEGEVEAWAGSEDLLATMRQLQRVNPKSPRLVADLRISQPDVWGEPAAAALPPGAVTRTLAEVFAAGAQCIVAPFHGGTNFGFLGGRAPFDGRSFVTASHDEQAPVREGGSAGPQYAALRRITTFGSQFARVLAALDPADQPALLAPRVGQPTLAPARGAQGGVAFIFHAEGHEPARKRTSEPAQVVLSDGSLLHVPIGHLPVVWCLFDAHLVARSSLDYSAFSAFALVGRTLVLFGPDGAAGSISINGSPIDLTAPRARDRDPVIIEHEGVTVVLCNDVQIDHTFFDDHAVYVGVASLALDGQPVALGAGKPYTRVTRDGKAEVIDPPSPASPAPKVSVVGWWAAPALDYVNGSSPRFAGIPGPSALSAMGTPFGYGWYRLEFRTGAARRHKVAAPESGDRLHLFLDEESLGIVGVGPGAELTLPISIKKGAHRLVVLADNMGRYWSGDNLGEPKGLCGHLWDIAPFKSGRMRVVEGDPVELLSFRVPLADTRRGDMTHSARATWQFMHRKKSPLIVTITRFIAPGLVLLNGKPIHYLDRAGFARIVLDHEQLTRGNNTLQLALSAEAVAPDQVSAALAELAQATDISEAAACLTEKAEFAFAKWEPPPPTAFKKLGEAEAAPRGGPTWWRCRFQVSDTSRPLFADLTGMTKGQAMLNGRDVGRYFVATVTGKHVPPQTRWYLPEPWLVAEGVNELLLFDEHGGNPGRVQFVYGDAPIGSV